ncbi:hypothetical protein VA599_13635 [Chromobacterium sp. TRC.1.1.SA]|uniref:Uncharacterized protein n=1 Tax=Chromobacterium indicum TaxID=3110228 RepID=A0ABV0CKV0_9NEIS
MRILQRAGREFDLAVAADHAIVVQLVADSEVYALPADQAAFAVV